jgi:hypothetical protein
MPWQGTSHKPARSAHLVTVGLEMPHPFDVFVDRVKPPLLDAGEKRKESIPCAGGQLDLDDIPLWRMGSIRTFNTPHRPTAAAFSQ